MLYLAIASTVLMVSTMLLSTLLESRVKNQTIAEVEQQGLFVMQMITQTVRNAEGIAAPAAGANGTSLTLDVLTAGEDPTVFGVASGTVYVTEGSGSAVALTNAHVIVSGFTVQNLTQSSTPGALRVSFTLTYVNPSGRNEYSFSKQFYGSASLRQP